MIQEEGDRLLLALAGTGFMKDESAVHCIIERMVCPIIKTESSREIGEPMAGKLWPDLARNPYRTGIPQRGNGKFVVGEHGSEYTDIEWSVVRDKEIVSNEEENLWPNSIKRWSLCYILGLNTVDRDIHR